MVGSTAALAAGVSALGSLAIGASSAANRVILAPMSGVTDAAMRRIASREGAGLVISEMVASDKLVTGDEETRLRAEAPGSGRHVVQLAGCHAGWMSEAARLAQGAGADIIDINMGCPAKRVTGGWAGSALMRDLEHAVSLVEATVASVAIPVTVKMRLGWDDASINAPELASRAEGAGAAMITVHGRTRNQFYKGRANWRAIAAVKAAVGIPVVANGDCDDLATAREMLAMSCADAVMIGRAAQGRAWLPGWIAAGLAVGREVPQPSLGVQCSLALEHYEGLLSLYGVQSGVRHARKHLVSAMEAAEKLLGAGDAALRRLVVTLEDPRAVASAFRSFFDSIGQKAAA
jgi:tRNA-dihydrouridine synthase B